MVENKKTKFIFVLFSALCFIAIFVCMICDFAINRRVSWSLYVLFSVLFGWAVLAPLFWVKKNKEYWPLAAITVLIVPYIFLMERITPAKDWFSTLGLPCAIVAILSIWATFTVFKFLKLNKWLRCSLTVFIWGVFSYAIIEFLVSRYVGTKLLSFDNILSFVSMLALSGLLFYIGRGHHISERATNEKESDK